MDKRTFTLTGYQLIEKVVKNGGDSGRVFVPKTWKDKRVAIILLDEITE